MAIGGIGYSQTYYRSAAVSQAASKDAYAENAAGSLQAADPMAENGRFFTESSKWQEGETERKREEIKDLLLNKMGITEEMLEAERADYPSAIEGRGDRWAPYSKLANGSNIVEYNGVVFTLDYDKHCICLGDMSNMDDVIRIPLSEGGCLMVNRDSIGMLGRAIGMFSPADINRILRALKLDAKVQQMKKEIEEMEDGIGKSSEEQNAQSDEEAKEVAQEKGKNGGFNGYGESVKNGIFVLEKWQLEMLTRDFSEQFMSLNPFKMQPDKIPRGEENKDE